MAKKGKTSFEKNIKAKNARPIRWRKYKFLYLIVCEDQNTEPKYFEKFTNKLPKENIYLSILGVGRDAKGVVEQAIIERDKLAEQSRREVDKTWVIFDKDDADLNETRRIRFEEAFTKQKVIKLI